MRDLVYFVRTWADPAAFEEMVAWLREKHLAEVVGQPGVEEGWLCVLEQSSGQRRGIMTFYRFSSPEAFAAYTVSDAKKRFDQYAAARFAGAVEIERLWGETVLHLTSG